MQKKRYAHQKECDALEQEWQAVKQEARKLDDQYRTDAEHCEILVKAYEDLKQERKALSAACDMLIKQGASQSKLTKAVTKVNEARRKECEANNNLTGLLDKLELYQADLQCEQLKARRQALAERREQLRKTTTEYNELLPSLLAEGTLEFLLRYSQRPSLRGEWELWRFLCRVLVLFWDVDGVAEEDACLMFSASILIEMRRRLPSQFSESEDGFLESMATLLVLTLNRPFSSFEHVSKVVNNVCKNRHSILSPDYIWTVPPLRLGDMKPVNVAYPVLALRETRIVEDYTVAWTAVLKQIHHKLECEGQELVSSTEAAKLLTVSGPAYAKTIKWSERLLFELRFVFRDLWRKQFACWDAAAVKFMWIEWINAGGPKDPKRQFMSDEDKADIQELRGKDQQSGANGFDSFSASHLWLTVDLLMSSGVRNGL